MIAIPRHLRAADELAWTASPSWCAPAAVTARDRTSPVILDSELTRRTARHSSDGAPLILGLAPPLTASTDSHAIQSP
jgi:hypothetical protein